MNWRAAFVYFAVSLAGIAGALDPIGAIALRSVDATLIGDAPIAQVEAGGPGWQANPETLGGRHPAFTWACAQGTATNFPNALGTESGHANEVGRCLVRVAPGVLQVHNYEAGYFTAQVIPGELPIQPKVVNQSFAMFVRNPTVDQDYDDYAAKYQVLFVSGAGNSGRPKSPGTSYNGISVGAYGGVSSIGPASDGRCKPDLAAPASYTSFAAPLVSGAAAILLKAGVTDIRLMKALLLNGAEKPPGWTNSATFPLDARYGAGTLNVYNSYRQFRASNSARCGWDVKTASIGSTAYLFTLDGRSSQTFEFTATLAWLRQYGQTNINNLDLVLYRGGELLVTSRSAVDNVEHVWFTGLQPGAYRLEVSVAGNVSPTETYALAYEFKSEQPPRFVDVRAGFSGTLQGEPLQAYRIEGTTDFLNWAAVAEAVTSEEGTLDFTALGNSFRFFRALELP